MRLLSFKGKTIVALTQFSEPIPTCLIYSMLPHLTSIFLIYGWTIIITFIWDTVRSYILSRPLGRITVTFTFLCKIHDWMEVLLSLHQIHLIPTSHAADIHVYKPKCWNIILTKVEFYWCSYEKKKNIWIWKIPCICTKRPTSITVSR